MDIKTNETHTREITALIGHKDLENLIANTVAKQAGVALTPGVKCHVRFEDATEGSPAYASAVRLA
ncbi:MAG: hypothetical protein ACXWLZ_06875 [Rhizomicrobium sp.]